MSMSMLRAMLLSAGWLFAAGSQAALSPVPLHLDVPVSDIGTDNSLANSNTSRKLAVGADGTIYALFRSATNGVPIAKSTDRGQSFGPSVQVSAADAEAEIAIASDGDLHVAFVAGGQIKHVVSHDGGSTFSTPTVSGTASSVHMAVDGDYVYIVPSNALNVYVSSDDGASFVARTIPSSYAFTDIFVDPLTHDVIVVADNPAVYLYVSHDRGQTFSGPTVTGGSVYYSVGALSVTATGRNIFMAGGSGSPLVRYDIDTNVLATTVVTDTVGLQTRSMSSDVFGNVVLGRLDASSNLLFEHSNDLGVTFGTATTVASSASRANAAINIVNGDILFLYEKNNQVYLSTYERALIGYGVNVSPSALNFGDVEVGQQASLSLTLTNVSNGPVAIAPMAINGEFTVSNDCGGSIAVGGSCTATVTFAPTTVGAASDAVAMTLGGAHRSVPVSAVAVPARASTSTALASSSILLAPGDDVTLTATVSGSALTGTVSFTAGGAPIADCTEVALAGTTATCSIANLAAGSSQYVASYSGDALNLPSTSSVVTLNVRERFTVTASASAGGSISPGEAQTVFSGETLTFNVVPDAGYRIDSVSGCGGSLSGTTYTTGAISAHCTVSAEFAEEVIEEVRFTVSATAAAGGSITPSAQSVLEGETATFTVAADTGYRIDAVTGCAGSLSGSVYTTSAISGACAVNATFASLNETVDVVAKSKGGGGAMGWPMLLIGALAVFARRFSPLFATTLLASGAHAEESQWYAGASAGQARGETTRGDVAADMTAHGFTNGAVRLGDLNREGYRLFVGYTLTPNWSAAIGYTDLGDVSSSSSASVPVGQAAAYANALVRALPLAPSGVEASVSYRYPITDSVAAAARVGVWNWQSEQSAALGNQRVSYKPDGTDVLFGVGADWRFASQWSVGLEASRYRTSREDFDLLAANVKFAW